MKRIGIVGITGFIGKIIKKDLINDGYEAIGLRSDRTEELWNTIDHLIFTVRSDKNITDKNGKLTTKPTLCQWHREFETDVTMSYEFAMQMHKQNTLKSIIFISSIYGKIIPTVREIPANYVCAKAAEIHMAKYLAVKLAPVRVNTIILGGVRSGRDVADQNDVFLEKYNKKTLLGKMTEPNEIYPAIKLLLENKGITGSEIEVSGGYGI